MNALVLALLIATSGPDSAPKPEVRGLLATRVTFKDEAGVKLAGAMLDLLATSTVTRAANEEEWLDAQRRCHVHARFRTPCAVDVADGTKVDVTEIVTTFPLASTGAIWVRSGARYSYFAKYRGPALGKIQALLSEAKSAE
jgi:hypothetical protein